MSDWNARYQGEDYAFGTEPNEFVLSIIHHLPKSGRALDLATGEGRNAVWLAWEVCAVDFTDVGLHKGRDLAARRGVAERVCFEAADLRCYRPEPGGFDLVTDVELAALRVSRGADETANLRMNDGQCLYLVRFMPGKRRLRRFRLSRG